MYVKIDNRWKEEADLKKIYDYLVRDQYGVIKSAYDAIERKGRYTFNEFISDLIDHNIIEEYKFDIDIIDLVKTNQDYLATKLLYERNGKDMTIREARQLIEVIKRCYII